MTVTAVFSATELPFIDIPDIDWYRDAIKYVYDRGFMIGTGDDIFEPDIVITRAEIVQILYNMEGMPAVSGTTAFNDVSEDMWCYDAVIWGEKVGVANGHGDGTFKPDDPVTREEFAQFMINYAEYKGKPTTTKGDLSQFTDADEISDWAVGTMEWAVGNKIFIGNGDGTLTPAAGAIRAEAAQIIKNFYENVM